MIEKLEYLELLKAVTIHLYAEVLKEPLNKNIPQGQLRNIIHHLLTVSPPLTIQTVYDRMDMILEYELGHSTIIYPKDLDMVGRSNICLYFGDISLLSSDIIVNAANTGLLGCFQPTHLCIDNVIHSKAGPRLRDACQKIIDEIGQESIGNAKMTPGFSLPSKYVIHTVGPQVEKGKLPTKLQEEQLVSCYTSALEEGLKSGKEDLTIAFPCISTGLFGFPSEVAAPLVVNSVNNWLKKHPQTSSWRVIFNTFLEKDYELYRKTLESLFEVKIVRPVDPLLNKSLEILKNTDYLLITGGAGLSASAGLDYTSEQVFKKHHPAMYKRGFRNMYQFIGFHNWTPALQWGYFFSQTYLARFNWKPTAPTYENLFKIFEHFENKNPESTFICTSNADGMFEQRGFPKTKILTIQGDYSRLQCLTPCSQNSIWDIKPFMDAALPFLDIETGELTNSDVIPKCPNCNGPLMWNVRGGDWFIESIFASQKAAYNNWVKRALKEVKTNGKRLAIIEIGAGYNTPGVLRIPNEKLAENENVNLIRINRDYYQLPSASNGVGVSGDANIAIEFLSKNFF